MHGARVAERAQNGIVPSDREAIVANTANKAAQNLGYASLKPEQLQVVAGDVRTRCLWSATYRLQKDFVLRSTSVYI